MRSPLPKGRESHNNTRPRSKTLRQKKRVSWSAGRLAREEENRSAMCGRGALAPQLLRRAPMSQARACAVPYKNTPFAQQIGSFCVRTVRKLREHRTKITCASYENYVRTVQCVCIMFPWSIHKHTMFVNKRKAIGFCIRDVLCKPSKKSCVFLVLCAISSFKFSRYVNY